ncbi:glutamate-5-semialdehyde dehydrogenase [Catalinimonas alkaloidigena]|uniref:glutamate-5-semialdehyde dehydrogenase n=1 Tax=Catalinimonas alkaloidigena TaxID=1075417 RepID=UPI002405225D|nr:glutamate-5-semialdehyde dehydrogenase [Catalinimonas alkaloidigena]MDF9798561.1 glutamate-5-semialdehyde dehydrogenase [Catalinimonas alkaloidigena]
MITATNITQHLEAVQKAARKAYQLSDKQINQVLNEVADLAVKQTEAILDANQKDLDRMDSNDPKYDRLMLTAERIQGIAADMRNVAKLSSPLGKVLEEKTLDNGLQLKKMSVPMGVIGIIYEARPNVTFDVFALCLKSGNACVLKGGSDAEFSNIAIASIIHEVLKKHQINEYMLYLMPAGREATQVMLEAVGYIDIIIPRGSQGLINFVRDHAKVPVIETGAGIVHTYFDESGDLKKGKEIIFNAKTRRVSVCNALDCLIIHRERLADLEALTHKLITKEVEVYADAESYAYLEGVYPAAFLHKAQAEHFGTEFLAHKMSIKTVGSLEEALDHIATYSSKHSEAIVAEDKKVIEAYMRSVDAAAVYANTSTAYTDGAQFGMGAEIGISTQKLHARGPMALPELTSYKWQIYGDGQVRG